MQTKTVQYYYRKNNVYLCFKYTYFRWHLTISDGTLLFPMAPYYFRWHLTISDGTLLFPMAPYYFRWHLTISYFA